MTSRSVLICFYACFLFSFKATLDDFVILCEFSISKLYTENKKDITVNKAKTRLNLVKSIKEIKVIMNPTINKTV